MAMVIVRVREDYRWPQARVAGRVFTRGGEVVQESDLNEEIHTSPLLQVEPVEATDAVDATEAAAELAREEGLDLRQVVGTGEGGRVLVGDVREVVGDHD